MSAPMSDNADSTGFVLPELSERDLSDQAVEILYDIVQRTQLSSDRTEDALYNACDELLDERRRTRGYRGEDVGVDVLYKFLRLMQDRKKRGESLVQRYQRVMQEIGVTIDVDENGDGVDVTTPFRIATRDALAEEPEPLPRKRLHLERGRHASFDSFLDGSADKIAGPTDTGHLRRGSDGTTANEVLEARALSQHQGSLPIRTRKDGIAADTRRVSSGQHGPPPKSAGSLDGNDSLRIRRSVQGPPSAYDTESESTSEFDFSRVQIPGVNSPIPNVPHSQMQSYAPEAFRPSDTRLLDDAEMFANRRLRALLRRCIECWRERTQEQIKRNEDMDRDAVALDRRRLLKDSMGDMRVGSVQRRNARETDRFFQKFEARADKARDLFLLTKSFTHWAKSAEEEVQRTSVARRHILRTRFFNGWREITAINELKIQHFILGRFLKKWCRRMDEVTYRQEFAGNMYNEKLARRVYRDWFFRYCEGLAPVWREVRIRRAIFQRWHEIVTLLRDRDKGATDRKERQLLRRSLDVWKNKVVTVQLLEPEGDRFRRRSMLQNTVSTLRRHSQFAPLLDQFQTQSNTHLAARFLTLWRRHTILSQQAKAADQMRLLRNAWTAWNDRLRIKALEERINDRVLVEAMYRWALASRVSLIQRVHSQTTKQSAFLTWVTRTDERRNTLDGAERRFAQFKRAQLLRITLRKLEVATAEKRAEEFAIKAQYEQRLKQQFLDKLKQKNSHFGQLNRWAEDARFFVYTTRTLKTWSAATQHARRVRRRDAYSQMRRRVKMNLVKKAFASWRAKTDVWREKETQANEIARNRTLDLAATLLSHIYNRATALRTADAEAQQHYVARLKYHYLNTWTDRIVAIQAKDELAVALRQENTEVAGLLALKKLGWRLWNIQRQEENAVALYQRNFEKHQRTMIKYWYGRAMELRAARPTSPTPSRRTRGGRGNEGSGSASGSGPRPTISPDNDENEANREGPHDPDADTSTPFSDAGSETQRLESWTAFDENALGLDNLDLSLSFSPPPAPPASLQPQSLSVPPTPVAPQSTRRVPMSSSSRRPQPPARRPITFLPQPPRSILRTRAAPEDLAFDDPSLFLTSTPMPPPSAKPGYLKTPSKRSVVRNKRSEHQHPFLPPSPEKRGIGRVGGGRGVAGSMSAPPVPVNRERLFGIGRGGGEEGAEDKVTSFEQRLVLGGVLNSKAGGKGGNATRGRERVVGFGDVSHFG
ncbi:unnamed protein product [Periconia digitata]|uniref:Sfi1 spindle body domain-containing protein n=1 Tax=Periconia digitata TaxID=1303443 RepID=A0A9W4XU79_9PLEO|nr:unnamed protein product [Periconia digitata]